MKYLLLILLACLFCIPVKAQTVVGPGSVNMSTPVKICRWNTSPACQWTFRLTNTSVDAVITKIVIDVGGSSALEVLITPGAATEISIPFPAANSLTADALQKAIKIYTRHKRPSDE